MAQMLTLIVGSCYREGAQQAVARLNPGDGLALLREPSNPHDKNAVAVYTEGGQHLGYVPRQDAPAVAKVMDGGHPYRCTVLKRGMPRISVEWEA